jgi:Cys-rich repeat protein
MEQRWKAWIFLATFSFIGACTSCFGSTSSCDFNQCETDADCEEGQRCFENTLGTVCAKPCTCDSECGEREFCGVPLAVTSDELRCARGCREDSDCAAGEVCDLQICREGCRAHEECPPNEACTAGFRCEVGCRDDAECPAGDVCDDRCRAGCRDASECEEGTVCVDVGLGYGNCAEGCAGDEECDAPARCLCGRCEEYCETDEDCGEGTLCERADDDCRPASCATPGLSCGAETCRPLAPSSRWPDLEPCCIPGSEPHCGYEEVEYFPHFHCGALIDVTGASPCACPEDECCLPDGSCGVVFHGLLGAPWALCVPRPDAADPLCVPAD